MTEQQTKEPAAADQVEDPVEQARAELAEEQIKLKGKSQGEKPKEKKAAPATAKKQNPAPEETKIVPEESEDLFITDNQKFNDRQFLQLLKKNLTVRISKEEIDELVRLGFPSQGFVKEHEWKEVEPSRAYIAINKGFNDRQFTELLKLTQEIIIDSRDKDQLITLGFPAEGFKAL